MSPDTPDSTEVEPEMARRCPVCETVFTVAYGFSRQVFCSPTCKAANSKPARRTCPVCENEFTTTVARRRTYCSEQCCGAARTSDDIRDQRVCLVCNGPFETLKTTRQIYCSPACRKDAERRRDQARDEDRARRLGETTSLPSWPEPPPPSQTPSRPLARQQVAAERDPLEPTATRNCPHCHQSVTIVALLATPEAARPSVPTAGPDISPLRRTQ
ncbi:hypothetical protein ACFCYX_39905 [Streptomyces populi]|uniref:hypothetical protein n=1 Tax=Streptomyces populi TaxID=2058924 RepID=UPI0013A69C2C|nr:hypothetical protein [Streptomyces populi]